MLPNKILSDEDLRIWCRQNVPGFVDVINRTQVPEYYKVMQPGESLIMNLDPNYAHGGTHWTALRVSSVAPLVYYKDSFGAPCPQEVVSAVNNSHLRGLIYGNKIYQKLNEVNCGKRAAYWLRDMAKCAETGNEIECFERSESLGAQSASPATLGPLH